VYVSPSAFFITNFITHDSRLTSHCHSDTFAYSMEMEGSIDSILISYCAYTLPLDAQFTSVNISSLKFQQNVGLLEEICAFLKLSARLWPRCYRDCEKVLKIGLYYPQSHCQLCTIPASYKDGH